MKFEVYPVNDWREPCFDKEPYIVEADTLAKAKTYAGNRYGHLGSFLKIYAEGGKYLLSVGDYRGQWKDLDYAAEGIDLPEDIKAVL